MLVVMGEVDGTRQPSTTTTTRKHRQREREERMGRRRCPTLDFGAAAWKVAATIDDQGRGDDDGDLGQEKEGEVHVSSRGWWWLCCSSAACILGCSRVHTSSFAAVECVGRGGSFGRLARLKTRWQCGSGARLLSHEVQGGP